MPKKLSQLELINQFNEIHNGYYNYDAVVYNGINNKIQIKCPIHGLFEQTPGSHKKYGCKQCGFNKIKQSNTKFIYTLADIEGYLKKFKPGYYEVEIKDNRDNKGVFTYLDSVLIKCNNHNTTNEKSIHRLLRSDTPCTKCSSEIRVNKLKGKPSKCRMKWDKFIEKCNDIFPKNFKLSYQRINYGIFSLDENIIVNCKNHQSSEVRKARNVINNKCACTKCSKRISKGEMEIMKLLDGWKINYEFQKIFDFLKIKYNTYLRMDLYLPELRICIEYDGEQHFKPIKLYGRKLLTIDDINNAVERDKYKEQLCNIHDIIVYRISCYDNIQTKLNLILNEATRKRKDNQ